MIIAPRDLWRQFSAMFFPYKIYIKACALNIQSFWKQFQDSVQEQPFGEKENFYNRTQIE